MLGNHVNMPASAEALPSGEDWTWIRGTAEDQNDDRRSTRNKLDGRRDLYAATRRREGSRLRIAFYVLASVLALSVPLIATANGSMPGRSILAVVFMLCIPGVPIALAFNFPEPLVTAALAVATSLVSAVIYGTISIVANFWHPIAGSWVAGLFGVICSVLAMRKEVRDHRYGRVVWVGRLDNGHEFAIFNKMLLGRTPSRSSADAGADLIAFPDESRTVSKTHLALVRNRNGICVVDRASMNGTTVTNPDGVSRKCVANESTAVNDGDIISFGNHWMRIKRLENGMQREIGRSIDGTAKSGSLLSQNTVTSVLGLGGSRVVALTFVAAAGVLWWFETRRLPLDQIASLGLLPVVGWRYVLALAVVSGVIIYCLLQPRLDHIALTAAAVLVSVMGYTTVAVADRAGSVPVGWLHSAFVEYISLHGSVPQSVDARFSWPGFFAAAAQLVALAGAPDSRQLLTLAPVAYTVLALPPLILIARLVTTSWRWAWVATFIYLVTNWYQQDYFSPQATAFIVYLAIVSTMLWLAIRAPFEGLQGSAVSRFRRVVVRVPELPAGVSKRKSQALGILLAGLVIGIVADHQLTPVSLIFSLLVFTVAVSTRYRLLWHVATLTLVGWFTYGATDFWSGHLSGIIGDIGHARKTIETGVSGRLVGNQDYQSAQLVRVGWSGLLFLAAAVGVYCLTRRPEVLLVAGLAGAPFALLLLQSYGGEVMIRCFLYASPVLAPLSAVAVREAARVIGHLRLSTSERVPISSSRLLRWSCVAALLPMVISAGLLLTFTRGLNASFERTPPDQLRAAQILHDRARPGDAVGIPDTPTPYGLTPYPKVTEVSTAYLRVNSCRRAITYRCTGNPRPKYILITITQERHGELADNRPKGWVWQLANALIMSGQYSVIYQSPDAWLLERTSFGSI